jgi:hypothetical protein
MTIEERKEVLKMALIYSFVEDYKEYKSTIDFINKDLIESKIDYQYTYDEFCVDFLEQTLQNLEEIDIFSFNEFNQFHINFLQFNLYSLQCMLTNKFNKLGYKYEDFYDASSIKKKIENKYK